SVARMLDIVKPGGIFYLSWRVTEGVDQRDKHRRLYAVFDASLILAELSVAMLLLDEEVVSASSGKKIHRLVVRKAMR
ncbi:MAG: SAM-dependent methyltransferase, partial [Bradyrhizobium sp.]